MRMDEFSRNELRDNYATIQELTSQVQKLRDRMNFLNDSQEFQIAVEKYLTFPVSRQSFQVLEHRRAATKASDLIHGSCPGHWETFFFLAIHVQ